MMKVCVDARMIRSSGIGTYLQNLLPTFAQHFDLILIGNPDEIDISNCHVVASTIPIYSIAEQVYLPRLIPSCDVFWSPHYNIPLLPIRAKKRLVTIHDVFHLAFSDTLPLKQKLYAKLLLNRAVTISHQVVTVSEFSKAEIVKHTHASPSSIRVIHNGINHQLFRVMKDNNQLESVRQQYQLPTRFALFVGNVKPHKNLISLVKAFAAIRDKIPDLYLVIVGKKEGFITGAPELFEYIHQNKTLADRIIFTGFVATEDLPVIYNLADLFVFPSLYEGFGLPPLEAMACGCPVLVADKASMPEVCGIHIDYIDPLDITSLAVKITEMINLNHEQRQTLSDRGVQKAAAYTWEKSIAAHIEVIRVGIHSGIPKP